jgi:hypothetical protein
MQRGGFAGTCGAHIKQTVGLGDGFQPLFVVRWPQLSAEWLACGQNTHHHVFNAAG